MLLSAFKGSAQNEGVTRSQYRSTGVDHIRATGPDSASGVLYRDFTQNACKPGTSSVFPCCGLVPFRNTDSPFVSTIPNHFRQLHATWMRHGLTRPTLQVKTPYGTLGVRG